MNIVDAFEIMVVGNKKEASMTQIKVKKVIKLSKRREVSSGRREVSVGKKNIDKMLLVPSLKHRVSKLCLCEKKISLLNSLQNIEPPTPGKNKKYSK